MRTSESIHPAIWAPGHGANGKLVSSPKGPISDMTWGSEPDWITDVDVPGAYDVSLTWRLDTPTHFDPLQTNTHCLSPNMAAEAFGIASGAIGLASTVFQTAKRIRDIIHTVGPSPLVSESLSIPCAYRRRWRSRRSLNYFKKTRKKWISSRNYTTNIRNILTKAS